MPRSAMCEVVYFKTRELSMKSQERCIYHVKMYLYSFFLQLMILLTASVRHTWWGHYKI